MVESKFISQFNLIFFKGRITDVLPVSVDSNTGSIYEQDILFQLENGITIPLSDNDLACNKKDIGQEIKIQMINGFRTSIEMCSNDNLEIGIFPNPINPEFSPTLRGTIEKIIESSEEKYKSFMRYATLDVGIGKILIIIHKDHKEDFSIFHEGDCVVIKGGRLDLLKVI